MKVLLCESLCRELLNTTEGWVLGATLGRYHLFNSKWKFTSVIIINLTHLQSEWHQVVLYT